MPKKIVFVLMLGVLLVSACTPTATPTAEPTDVVTEEVTSVPTTAATEITYTGQMPCMAVFDYELSEEAAAYQAVVDQLPPVTDADWILGDPDAPVTIIEYSDFQCPACGNYAMNFVKPVLELFPDSVRIVFRDMPLPSIHDKAYISSMVGKAAGNQGLFWEMYDILYMNQSVWFYYTEEEFIDWAKEQAQTLGLDMAQFEADVYDEDVRAALEENTNDLLNLGVHYTPFVIINDRISRDGNPDLFSMIGLYQYNGSAECPDWVIDPSKSYTAILDTTVGEIAIDLFADVAPLAVNNFVFLAQKGWYDGLSFHRVIEDYIAQTGDPSGTGYISPGYKFVNETDNGLSFDKAGVVGMANPGADQNGSQFFITMEPAADLDGGYTIFGQVQEGSLALIGQIAVHAPAIGDLQGDTLINSIEIIEN